MNNETSLERAGFKDIKRAFPLLTELFEYAESRGLNSTGFDDYGREGSEDNSRAIEFPEKFSSLIAEHPGKYFIVAYDNRRDLYYTKGSRYRMIRLSNVRRRSQANERVREVDLKEVDPDSGNKVQIKVKESVNNKSFANINTATGAEVEQPHGEAEYMYELDPQGNKTIKETSFNRLDEGLFEWKGENKPVRWVRNLKIGKDEQGTSKIMYEDLYIVGRMEKGETDERAQVKTYITGSLDAPESVSIEIGIGAPASAQVLYEDKKRKIKVIVHQGINAFKDQLQIIQQEPAYAALLRKPLDIEELMKDINFKARMLREDWDKSKTVFSKKPAIESSRKELGS